MLPLRKKRVLLLDDDSTMQRLIGRILRSGGFRVDIVSTGRLAIERIETNDYAAILLDLMTPTEGGATVVRHLRGHRPELVARVLIVSGAPDSVIRRITRQSSVLRKPFEPEALLRAVREIAG